MARTLPEALAGLEADVRQVRLAPAADIRARGRRRAWRGRAGVTVSVLALGAAATFLPFREGRQPAPPAAPSCAAPVDLSLPTSLGVVGVRVVDATGRAGAGQQVVAELRERGFGLAVAAGTVEPLPNDVVGIIRYGPRTVGDTAVVQSVYSDQVELVFERARADDMIDIVMGPAFQQLGTPTEVNQRLAHAMPESLPHGCQLFRGSPR